MRYYLIYVQDCTPSYRTFKSERALRAFVKKLEKRWDGSPDSWVDYIFKGECLYSWEDKA